MQGNKGNVLTHSFPRARGIKWETETPASQNHNPGREFKLSDLSHWYVHGSPAVSMRARAEQHFVGGALCVGQWLLHLSLLKTRYAFLPAH